MSFFYGEVQLATCLAGSYSFGINSVAYRNTTNIPPFTTTSAGSVDFWGSAIAVATAPEYIPDPDSPDPYYPSYTTDTLISDFYLMMVSATFPEPASSVSASYSPLAAASVYYDYYYNTVSIDWNHNSLTPISLNLSGTGSTAGSAALSVLVDNFYHGPGFPDDPSPATAIVSLAGICILTPQSVFLSMWCQATAIVVPVLHPVSAPEGYTDWQAHVDTLAYLRWSATFPNFRGVIPMNQKVLLELPGDFPLTGVKGPERRQRSF